MCENCFSMCFFEGGDLKVQLSWRLKGVNMYTIEMKPPVPSETITSPQNTQKQNLKISQ